jgi:hypothetical protein
MNKLIGIITGTLLLFSAGQVTSQTVGFSYFFPAHGYFSNPVAPLNFSFPVSFGKYVEISPEISMHSIGGMSMTGLGTDLNSKRPLVGPFQSINGCLIPAIVIPAKSFKVDIMAGLFGFASINTKLMHGNFDAMFNEHYDYYAISSDVQYDKDYFGWGYVYGVKFSFKVRKNIWGYVGGKYYMGSQGMPLSGTIRGATEADDIVRLESSFPDAAIRYEGIEFIVGVSIK